MPDQLPPDFLTSTGAEGRPIRVVVLGGGFGGLNFCQHFSHPRAQVTLVDRTNHHLFQPLLYQVAMAGLSATEIAQPIRSILSRKARLEVIMEEVCAIDLNGRRVICNRNEISYDYLIIALGSITSYFGQKEWEKFAPGLKTLDDALLIRRNVLYAFEQAETERDPARQQTLMTIVIIGGGPTGVELAGACAELAHRVLRRDFDRIDPRRARVILIEGHPRVLAQFPEDLSQKARQQLEHLQVQVRTSCKVKTITEGKVMLETGEEIVAGNILWAAGVMASPLTANLGVELDRAGRIKVNPDLSLPDFPEVFAIGDLVSASDPDGKPVPGVAPAAMQMAKHIASVLATELDGRIPSSGRPPFRYFDKGSLATIGRSKGVAWFGKVHFSGFFAWMSWLLVHLLFLIGFRNKLSVLVSWIYAYVTYKLGARIITGSPSRINPGAETKPGPPEAQLKS